MTADYRLEQTNKICDDIKQLITNKSNQSKIGMGNAIFNISELFKKYDDNLTSSNFVELIRRSGSPQFTMSYQTYRYYYNLGYLYNFTEQKLFCNCLRKASEVKNSLVSLNYDSQKNVKAVLIKHSFVTIKLLEDLIRVEKGEKSVLGNSVEDKIIKLKEAFDKLMDGLGDMIIINPDMPRGFHVEFSKKTAKKLWDNHLSKSTSSRKLQLKLVNIQTLFYSLIDISAIMLDNKTLKYVKILTTQSELFKDCPVNESVPRIIIYLFKSYLNAFNQDRVREISSVVLEELTEGKALFEFVVARNAIRTMPAIASIYSEFY
ncbi:hypothetical protein C9J21_18170 [Photobacterium phosphoreum]|uniref:hypothetical protein n=1 Tax=Photobacterium phosphoreum TaxID=659 RepID=UPI000D1783AD|nr:hypothetical protein [Photobacterium phosphoreum]PSW30814.1 hypothetical protein C9J21_18170 [Photobacterium phosphoreum]